MEPPEERKRRLNAERQRRHRQRVRERLQSIPSVGQATLIELLNKCRGLGFEREIDKVVSDLFSLIDEMHEGAVDENSYFSNDDILNEAAKAASNSLASFVGDCNPLPGWTYERVYEVLHNVSKKDFIATYGYVPGRHMYELVVSIPTNHYSGDLAFSDATALLAILRQIDAVSGGKLPYPA